LSGIRVTDLTKRWGDYLVVDHISFQIEKGKLFGFLGPNGAGKTTTLRMMTGIIKPDSGSVSIMGYDIQRDTLKAKQIMGIVPETNGYYSDLSAWDNIMFMAEIYGVSRKRAKKLAEELLEKTGLIERKDQKVSRFSQGMKRRLVLAMAFINDPEVLFLDEPTSGLDVKSRQFIMEIVKEFSVTGGTVFMTTHDIKEANWLCDQIAIINKGKIIAVDTPSKLKRQIRNLQAVEVSFSTDVNPEELKSINKVAIVKKIDGKIKLYTDEPGSVVEGVVGYAVSRGLKITHLATLSPSLEDVFLEITKGESNNG